MGSACSTVVWPSRIIVMSDSRLPPPSGTTSMPSSRAASMIHCRCSRRGCMYDFTEKAPESLQPPHVVAGVVEALDDGPAREVGAVEDEAGGEDARTRHEARLHHLRLAEGLVAAGRRIVGRGDAVGQVREVLPRPLREDVEGRVVQVGVLVEEAGDDRAPGDVHHPGLRRNRDRAGPDGLDAVARPRAIVAASRTSSPFMVTTRAPV